MSNEAMRLVIVSNRLPSVVERHHGSWRVRPATGGLITAMAPVLRDRGGTWIGWSGTLEGDQVDLDALLAEGGRHSGYSLSPVVLTAEERDKFYNGFANEIIWPLFHSLDDRCTFDPAYWKTYQRVNAKFAEAVHGNIQTGNNFVWVHDYHLMTVGAELRRMNVDAKVGFFLHIPFPPLDIFLKLPWRFQILHGLLSYDMVGFQTVGDRRNFMHCIRTLLKDVKITGRGRMQTIQTPTQTVRVGTFPISIDFNDFARKATTPGVQRHMASLAEEYADRKIILGLDRLDYTKGIPHRLRAFRNALRRHPDLRRQVTLVQVVVPSRESVPAYQRLKEEIDELVGEINGEHTEPGWVPIHYHFRSLSQDELLAYYRIADVCLVTPLKDGMNLVAKEYCACNLEETGVLVLSEFAGAAAELQQGALLVNPYDREGVADAIHTAVHMPEPQRRTRMSKLRKTIRQRCISWWLDSSLQASFSRSLDDFPPADLYVPRDCEGASVTAPTTGLSIDPPRTLHQARQAVSLRRTAPESRPDFTNDIARCLPND